jgi:hypothetical protein
VAVTAITVTGNTVQSGTGSWQINMGNVPFNVGLPANTAFNAGYANTDKWHCFANYCGATALYGTYRPLMSTISVKSLGPANSGFQGIKVAVAPVSVITGAYTSYRTIAQGSYSKEAPISMVYAPAIVTNKIFLPKLYGISNKTLLGDPNYAATSGALPVNYANWEFFWQTTDGAITAAAGNTLVFEIKATLLVRYEQPNYVSTFD